MADTKCLNGVLRRGDLVLSTADDAYGCLVGRVFNIIPLGAPDRDTDNKTDDVYVDFSGDYSDKRIMEIETAFSGLYDESKTMDDIALDYVIMDPECLIRITGTDDKTLAWLMESEENAELHAYRVLRRQSGSLKEASGNQHGMRPVSGSYYGYVDGVHKEVPFERGLFHMWGNQSTEYENGAVADTVAIVELPDGTVRTVYPNKLAFVNQE